jgi:hypothetical protein
MVNILANFIVHQRLGVGSDWLKFPRTRDSQGQNDPISANYTRPAYGINPGML